MGGIDTEWRAAAIAAALAGVGWGVHNTLLALAGTLGAFTAVLLWVWQRQSLTGVTFRRTLGQHRAGFGEHVSLDVEFVNDKLLPLTWLHVSDAVPTGLTIQGGASASSAFDDEVIPHLHHLLPMLPYGRVRRRLIVECDQRGEHTFGPAHMRSGNPAGYRAAYARVSDTTSLLVYPKVFRLASASPASRVPLGDDRSRLELLGDPSRPVGVRAYRAGDPIRHIDWRASARSPGLLVQVFEPTTTLRVAVFADTRPPHRIRGDVGIEEFTVALTASVVTELTGRGIATGLYSSAMVDGRAIASPPSASAAALPAMLELLARCRAWNRNDIGELLINEGSRLGRGASAILIAADFPVATLAAVAQLRRRLPITLIWVANEHGSPPPSGSADVCWEVNYHDDWKSTEVLELAR